MDAVNHIVRRVTSSFPNRDPFCPDTGGEVTWKPVGTSWVNCGLWIIFLPMYPPIAFWVHSDCDLNICPACTYQITFKMLPEMVPKYSCNMPSHTQGWSSNVPSIYSIVFHVPSMYPERVACSQNIPTGHIPGTFLTTFVGAGLNVIGNYMLGTC